MEVISCENPMQEIWNQLKIYENEEYSKKYLLNKYLRIIKEKANTYAFQNAFKFSFYLKQARIYLITAETSELLVKPLLYYYGLTSYMKAIILLSEPQYPNNSTVLQHGITTRKIKKSNYQFMQDEIKIQQNGLFPLYIKTISQDDLTGKKIKIIELISLIPELANEINKLYHIRALYPAILNEHSNQDLSLILNIEILKQFDENIQLFTHWLKSFNITPLNIEIKNKEIIITLDNKEKDNRLLVQDYRGNYFFKNKEAANLQIPDEVIIPIIMYNLGMLSRYEAELWGNIVNSDTFIIELFLQKTYRIFPNLILNKLNNNIYVFRN